MFTVTIKSLLLVTHERIHDKVDEKYSAYALDGQHAGNSSASKKTCAGAPPVGGVVF